MVTHYKQLFCRKYAFHEELLQKNCLKKLD